MPLDRHRLRGALEDALRADPRVLAAWEGGSAAFDRLDDGSDIDLQALVEPDAVEATWERVEETLASVGTIDLVYRVPEPAWHGHSQRFYRLAEAGPLLLIDMTLMRRGSAHLFLEPERHGRAVVLFDREGLLADPAGAAAPGPEVLEAVVARFEMFQAFTLKELGRERAIDAFAFFQGMMRDVVQILRLRYDPLRWDFGMRYLHTDLPVGVAVEVQALLYVGSPDKLADHHARAVRLARETIRELRG